MQIKEALGRGNKGKSVGVYLNPGNDRFQMVCNSEIYVDKTGLLALTNKMIGSGQNCVCFSRPSGFGKSVTAFMLAAYYGKNCDSGELFAPYEFAGQESYEEHLNRHNVIFFNVQKAFYRTGSIEKMLRYIQKEILEELEEAYGDRLVYEEGNLSAVLEKLYSRSKEKFIFIMDDWDYVFHVESENEKGKKKYMDFLQDLFKDQPYVSLACMTGILPVKKYKTYSSLNIFDDYSVIYPAEYAEYIGFTGEEANALCEKYRMDLKMVSSWYGGYIFSSLSGIYNPGAVVSALRLGEFVYGWTQAAASVEVKKYINMNYDGLKDAVIRMMEGEGVAVHTEKIRNDITAFSGKDEILILLVHLGYLAYDRRTSMVFIPNTEMMMEFCSLLEVEV